MSDLRRRCGLLRLALLTTPLLLGGCAVKYSTAALGDYAAYEPFATMNRSTVWLEVNRDAHVAVLAVRTPMPGYDTAPVLFDVMYPVYETDRTHFRAGKHVLLPRQTSMQLPPQCRESEVPALAGCRRRLRPGLRGLDVRDAYQRDVNHYIVIVADEFIDPYTLADELFYAVFEDDEVADLLKARDAETAAASLERVLLDRRMAPGWAGLYVTNR
ncbi:hypothetical protein BH23GEM9_BH23GEM9_35740 [soil metagenome]